MSVPSKGSILVATGTGKYDVYPPGQNNQILIVDSQEEYMMKYVDASTIIPGATGSQGIQGPTGSQGIQGPTGDTGLLNAVMSVVYGTASTAFFSYNSTTYRTVSDFYYAGTSVYRSLPTQFSVIANTNTSNGAFNVKLVDITNSSNVIASIGVTGAGTSQRVYTTTTFTNVTTTPAVWELQINGKPSGASNTSTGLYSMYVKFT